MAERLKAPVLKSHPPKKAKEWRKREVSNNFPFFFVKLLLSLLSESFPFLSFFLIRHALV